MSVKAVTRPTSRSRLFGRLFHIRRDPGRIREKLFEPDAPADGTCLAEDHPPAGLQRSGTGLAQLRAASLSWVLVSKSPASWRSCNWLEGSPEVRLTMRPRLTAGRS